MTHTERAAHTFLWSVVLPLLCTLIVNAQNISAQETEIQCDVAVIGASPAGIACAVRAAREGVSVILVNRHNHLGGMLYGMSAALFVRERFRRRLSPEDMDTRGLAIPFIAVGLSIVAGVTGLVVNMTS